MDMIIAMPDDERDAFIADVEQRFAAADLYADECIAVLVAQYGADPARVDREIFKSHHFSRVIDGKPVWPPVLAVAHAIGTWIPSVLGMVAP